MRPLHATSRADEKSSAQGKRPRVVPLPRLCNTFAAGFGRALACYVTRGYDRVVGAKARGETGLEMR
jgi:hypothetical protein